MRTIIKKWNIREHSNKALSYRMHIYLRPGTEEKGESKEELAMADFLFRETYRGSWANNGFRNPHWSIEQEESRILKHVKNYDWW